MIKLAVAANRHPTGRSLAEFHRYWAESHGPLVSNSDHVRRYVQHATLPESYGHSYAPTFDAVSVFWFDDLVSAFEAPTTAHALDLQRAVVADEAQLFDRDEEWPVHQRQASVVAEEVVILDGPVRPDMVKTLVFACRLPGLSLSEFFAHWRDVHGPLAVKAPGLRRYVQNHAVPAAYAWGTQTHDGWAEMWFDDLDAVYTAVSSPEWGRLHDDGDMVFTRIMGTGIGRERVQKDLDWSYQDFGVGDLDHSDIVARLAADGYASLAETPNVAAKIKAAANSGHLALWTPEHLVTVDSSRIDARPDVDASRPTL